MNMGSRFLELEIKDDKAILGTAMLGIEVV